MGGGGRGDVGVGGARDLLFVRGGVERAEQTREKEKDRETGRHRDTEKPLHSSPHHCMHNIYALFHPPPKKKNTHTHTHSLTGNAVMRGIQLRIVDLVTVDPWSTTGV